MITPYALDIQVSIGFICYNFKCSSLSHLEPLQFRGLVLDTPHSCQG